MSDDHSSYTGATDRQQALPATTSTEQAPASRLDPDVANAAAEHVAREIMHPRARPRHPRARRHLQTLREILRAGPLPVPPESRPLATSSPQLTTPTPQLATEEEVQDLRSSLAQINEAMGKVPAKIDSETREELSALTDRMTRPITRAQYDAARGEILKLLQALAPDSEADVPGV